MTLHLTNGDSAVHSIRVAGFAGEHVPWRDVLHEGPLPAGLSLEAMRAVRARYIARMGWAPNETQVQRDFAARDAAIARWSEHEEVVLWFEHDLYDQLQLVQILDWLAQQPAIADGSATTRAMLAQSDDYLGPMTPEPLRAVHGRRASVTQEQLDLAREAWRAFTSPTPEALVALLAADTSALPYLHAAIRRHLQQLPWTRDGLSRSERQALRALADGPVSTGDTFVRSAAAEEAVFLGDIVHASYLERLSRGDAPLVTFDDGAPVAAPRTDADGGSTDREFWGRRLLLTRAGHAVLAGNEDWVRLAGVDRWLGGVQLEGRSVWRWDEARVQAVNA